MPDFFGKKKATEIKKKIDEIRELTTSVSLDFKDSGCLVKRQLRKLLTEKERAEINQVIDIIAG